ncbi:BTB domain-containing protein [Meloidogyne graminicola]|uniref:BTB domain-containing protein n=1 Tax=Meloidogyne graminicola TaxID=189291 RepID=A0A8S9ZUA7_9BILA|nr:BTB domain-containing protein [Meloidogyne graminicola]
MSISNKKIISSNKVWNVTKVREHLRDNYNISSSRFWSEEEDTISWKIVIDECKESGNESVYVSIQQVGLKGNDIVKAEYYFYVIQNDETKIDIKRSTHEFKHFTKSNKVNVNIENLLRTDGSITIGCEVKFSLKDINLEYVNKNIIQSYSKLLPWKTDESYDCIIQIGSESFNVHKSVLSKNSVVFRRMIERKVESVRLARRGSFKEINIVIVRINDCTSECFRVILEYSYTGSVAEGILETLAEDLFAVAHKYELVPLKEKCEHFMASIINDENISQCFRIVHIYNSTILENAISNYVRANRKTFLRSEEWKKLSLDYPNLAVQLLACVIEEIDK